MTAGHASSLIGDIIAGDAHFFERFNAPQNAFIYSSSFYTHFSLSISSYCPYSILQLYLTTSSSLQSLYLSLSIPVIASPTSLTSPPPSLHLSSSSIIYTSSSLLTPSSSSLTSLPPPPLTNPLSPLYPPQYPFRCRPRAALPSTTAVQPLSMREPPHQRNPNAQYSHYHYAPLSQ